MLSVRPDHDLERLKRALEGICMNAVGYFDDDLIQEGLIAGWRAMQTWRENCGRTRLNWMGLKARYRVMDVYRDRGLYARRGARRLMLEPLEPAEFFGDDAVEDNVDPIEAADLVTAELLSRSVRDRRIVALHAIGHPHVGIAAEYGVSEALISRIVHRTLRSINAAA